MTPCLRRLLPAFLSMLTAVVAAAPLRVLIVSDNAAVTPALAAVVTQGGAQAITSAGLDAWPLAQTDAVLLYGNQFKPLPLAQQKQLADFAAKGGAIVAVHGAVAFGDAEWGRAVLGGAWTSESQKFRNKMLLTLRTDAHPITADASTFDIEEDTLYDLALNEKILVLSSAFSPKVTNAKRKAEQSSSRASVYDIQPQIWALEAADHRAVVILPGAELSTLSHASVRAFIARGLAWAARRPDANELVTKADLASLRYPVGGPRRGPDAVAQFRLQPGFRASVLATEPLINKPIAMQFDERGRLWVAETPEYPNGRRPLTAEAWKEGGVLVPGSYDRPAQDKISVLVSSKNDGVYDQKQVFHQGLELVTGFCLYKDGVIAVCQPNIVWLRDTDGDGKADKEVVLYGGFTPGDTHFVANHFILAPDGWVYASNGGGGEAFFPADPSRKVRISPGTFRFKPDGSAIEQVASQGGNSFGNEVTSTMELFHGKATNGNPIQHVVLPEPILAKVPGTGAKAFASVNPRRAVARADLPDRAPLMQIDQVGHYSAACGAAVYEGGAWPKIYNGTVFMSEPILDIIHHEKMNLAGPAYVGELLLQDQEWLRSTDHWFCPVDMNFGPDGAMYVLDFYTPVVAHNDTRGPLHSKSGASVRPDREHYFGRIYRIQHEDAPPLSHPDLVAADIAGLVEAFKHPSKVVRFNAIRVLLDREPGLQASAIGPLSTLVRSDAMPEARIQALWALQRLDRLEPGLLAQLAADPDADVRKNAFLVAEAGHIALPTDVLKPALVDANGRVRLAALRAVGAAPMNAETGRLLLASQKTYEDEWSKAAASAAASANPGAILEAIFAGGDKAEPDFARSLAASLAAKSDGAANLRAVRAAAKASDVSTAILVLRELSDRRAAAPSEGSATEVFSALLASSDAQLASASAPLAVQWDGARQLGSALSKVAQRLLPVCSDASAPLADRVAAVRTLVALRFVDASILPALGGLLRSDAPPALLLATSNALVSSGDVAVGPVLFAAFPRAKGELRNSLYAALMTRADWAQLVLSALESKSLSPMQLGPLQSSQLLRHPDDAVSKRAAAVFAKLSAGTSQAKDDVIAKLRPEVEKPGDVQKGREAFATACAVCHKIGDVGHEFGPNLQGIGSHPASELLVHIVDPNRMVDDEHRTWNFKMKDGSQYSALIASENTSVVKLRQPGGIIVELKVADIASRERMPNSLMPEGFEALGAETLRNLIAYIRSTAVSTETMAVGRFRLLDLSGAFTADSREGLYASRNAKKDSLPFVKYGQVTANGVPYVIADPVKSKGGKNVVVLKGGPGDKVYARSLPQSVEVPVGLAATRLHLLGAVAGWGNHGGGDMVGMTVDIHYVSGRKQSVRLYGAKDIADYISPSINVPGSKLAEGVVSEHQVRTLVIPVESQELIEKLVLSSPGNEIAATTVAITAEVGGPPNPPAAKVAPKSEEPAGPDSPKTTLPTGQKFGERKAGILRVLVAGAGSSHHFPKYFLGTDAAVIRGAGYDVAATPNLEEALALLPQADLLVFSGNHKQYGSADFQKALNAFADAGKGIVLLHAGVWYNWPIETRYNERFVAGGSRNHGHGDFIFTVTQAGHPVMKGVPPTFVINDESYNVELTRPEAAEVLGTIPRQTPKPGQSAILPSVWVVKDPKTRIVCVALGHDEHSHDHPAYRQILLNALGWVAQK